jgi:hypothetical protein
MLPYTGAVATKKQIKMERKRERHGYDRPPVARPVTSAPEKKDRGGSRKPSTRDDAGVIVQGRRKLYPPSWLRSARRVAFFPPFFFILIHFVIKPQGNSLGTDLALTALYSAASLPITYFMDRMMYNRARARSSAVGAAKRRSS